MFNQKNMDARITEICEKYGAFFAFGQKQFDEQSVEGVEYTRISCGLIVPKKDAQICSDALSDASKAHKKYIIENNTPSEIIQHELNNHEAGYTGEIDDTVDAVACFDITRKQVEDEFPKFMQKCIDQDML